MSTLTIENTTIAYEEHGAGTPVVLIHAFPLHRQMWGPQVAALAGQARLIIADVRGFGASDLGSSPPSIDRYADDVAALLDHLGVDRAVIGGLSMGGYIAFAFLRRHRARVAGLLLANTRALPDTDAARSAREANARLAEAQGVGALAEQMLPRLLSPAAPQALTNDVRAIILENQGVGIAAALRAMAQRTDSTDLLRGIAVPTLVIGSDADVLIPLTETRMLQAAIPQCRLVEIANAGHLSNLEAPEIFSAALATLINEVG